MSKLSSLAILALAVWLLTHQHCGRSCHLDETDLVLGQHHTETPGVTCK